MTKSLSFPYYSLFSRVGRFSAKLFILYLFFEIYFKFSISTFSRLFLYFSYISLIWTRFSYSYSIRLYSLTLIKSGFSLIVGKYYVNSYWSALFYISFFFLLKIRFFNVVFIFSSILKLLSCFAKFSNFINSS